MLLNVKSYVERQKKDLKEKIDVLVEKPVLSIISLEEDAASQCYMKNKLRLAEELGIYARVQQLNINTLAYDELDAALSSLKDSICDGIIIQIPANRKLDDEVFTKDKKSFSYRECISKYIDKAKDVDGLSLSSAADLYAATSSNKSTLRYLQSGTVPCTAAGIVNYLTHLFKEHLLGKDVVIVGRSDLVGKPLSLLLTGLDCTTTLCHSKTQNLREKIKSADIVVSAIGKPHFFDRTYFKDGQTLIDVCISRVDNHLVGDIDKLGLENKRIYYTPVPGGVGLLTTLQLMTNVYLAAAKKSINQAVTI